MKSGHIGLLVLKLAENINLVATPKASKLYTEQTAQMKGTPDIYDYLDQKYWSDLGFIGLYGKLEAFNVCYIKSGDIGL